MNWIKRHKAAAGIWALIVLSFFFPALLGGLVFDTSVSLAASAVIWLLVWSKRLAWPLAFALGALVTFLWWRGQQVKISNPSDN